STVQKIKVLISLGRPGVSSIFHDLCTSYNRSGINPIAGTSAQQFTERFSCRRRYQICSMRMKGSVP
ncbi:hypothetical protein RZS08_61665, partial [Arthrospira platensis SPKY1]|nr:hypothetical protein [Arthrospira platensis SPKY1]